MHWWQEAGLGDNEDEDTFDVFTPATWVPDEAAWLEVLGVGAIDKAPWREGYTQGIIIAEDTEEQYVHLDYDAIDRAVKQRFDQEMDAMQQRQGRQYYTGGLSGKRTAEEATTTYAKRQRIGSTPAVGRVDVGDIHGGRRRKVARIPYSDDEGEDEA